MDVVINIKKEIEFWINAISVSNISKENKELLNQCLQIELNRYLYPTNILFSTEPLELKIRRAID